MGCRLVRVASASDWRDYHAIRSTVLWDARGRLGYDHNHPDDRRVSNHPFLLMLDREAVGTIRLDDLGEQVGAVRLVSIVKERQRHGHGRAMLHLAERHAVRLGWVRLMVNAAVDAVGFYAKLGWHPLVSREADLADSALPCAQMTKALPANDMPHKAPAPEPGRP